MAWTGTGLGTLAGITTVITGLTGPAADADQITAVKTLLLSEVSGICTTLYNGAKLTVSGDAGSAGRSLQFSLIPLDLDLAP